MEALICKEPGRFEYADIQQPQLQPGYAIIKVRRVGICGTDLHAFEGTQPFFSYPRILGHEVSGELVDVSNATGFQTGELVTFIPYFNCGACVACRTGKPNCCAQLMVCGVHADGGHA
jgi:threonine dehydrogenase-like Zn-dependent dehydrogenase